MSRKSTGTRREGGPTPPLTSKLPDVEVTIFSVMTRLAHESGALNLSQGFPDFPVSPELIDLVTARMQAGHNQYAPMEGVLPLREALAVKVERLYGARVDPDTEVTVTAGATEAVFAAIAAVVQSGDEVIVFEPAYDAYAPAIRLNGGRPVFVRLGFPGYRVDWEAVSRAITPRTRMLILNSPHNPTGTVLAAADIEALAALVADTRLLILSDEVYEHIVFDGRRHESLLRSPELAARSFVVGSFGKTYHATGWKIGYCVAPSRLTAELRKVHQYLTFAVNTPVQLALADFMARHPDPTPLAAFYQAKRDRFRRLLAGSRFRLLDCEGTYFQMLDYRDISVEPDLAFARRLTREHGVAAIPPAVFYHRGDDHRVLRFCFAKGDDTLAQAAERLCRI
jgi:methionine aminotransferase